MLYELAHKVKDQEIRFPTSAAATAYADENGGGAQK